MRLVIYLFVFRVQYGSFTGIFKLQTYYHKTIVGCLRLLLMAAFDNNKRTAAGLLGNQRLVFIDFCVRQYLRNNIHRVGFSVFMLTCTG